MIWSSYSCKHDVRNHTFSGVVAKNRQYALLAFQISGSQPLSVADHLSPERGGHEFNHQQNLTTLNSSSFFLFLSYALPRIRTRNFRRTFVDYCWGTAAQNHGAYRNLWSPLIWIVQFGIIQLIRSSVFLFVPTNVCCANPKRSVFNMITELFFSVICHKIKLLLI